MILIEDAGIFSKAGDELGEYLKDSSESTHLYFVEESVDKRSKLYKAAAGAVILWSSRNRRMRHLPDG